MFSQIHQTVPTPRRPLSIYSKGVRLGLILAAGAFLAGAAWAQLRPPIPAPPPGQENAQGQVQVQPTPDSITNEQIKLLEESGLIAQQSRLSEGLLLMDRQLRQAQLVEQLLAVLGPDAQIEVTPGEFKTFEDTPAGLRERIAYLELQLQLKEAQEKMGTVTEGQITSTVTEVFGVANDYTAVINSNGKEARFGAGDQLADGSVILSISPDQVRIQATDGTIRALDTP